MSRRERPISKTDARLRADHARAYLIVADLIADDDAIAARTNVLGAIAVLAGIAASDAISGNALGVRSSGDAHTEAVELLRRATPPSSKAPNYLSKLLAAKTDTQYSAALVSSAKARELHRAAAALVAEMDERLRS
jgi:hypothetical protein